MKSNSISEGDNGKMLFNCFAGCSYQDIVTTLGISSNGYVHKEKIEAIYDYTDEENKLLYQNLRFEGKEFRWRHFDKNGGEVWNLNGARAVSVSGFGQSNDIARCSDSRRRKGRGQID